MTIIDNMLKMKKMNGLKIFALVLLSLSKFETMFGMEGDNISDDIEKKFNDEYVNKNYYLIDHLGNKITLDNGEDIKFKIYLDEELNKMKVDRNKDILKIPEEKNNKILINIQENEKGEETDLSPIIYKNGRVFISHEKKDDDNLGLVGIELKEKEREEYKKNAIPCKIVKKIGEESMNDDYILVDAENKKIEKINGKNIVFKLLTRKKCLELNKKLKDPQNYLKNNKGKYILDDSQKPLLFEEEEEEENNLILYVKRLGYNLYLAWLLSHETTIKFNNDNSIEVHMAKKKEIDKIEGEKVKIDKIDEKEGEKVEKKEILKDNDSSECCCGIC